MGNTRGTIHVDTPLTNFSLKFKNGMFIADMIFPRVDVSKDSDLYFIYGQQDQNVVNTLRAPKTDPNYIDSWKTTTSTFTCEEHSLADLVGDDERKLADTPLAPDYDCTENLTNMLGLDREKRVADLITTTANLPAGHYTTLTTTMQWNNASYDSDSKTDAIEVRIDAGKEVIRKAIGLDPNVIIFPSAVSRVVKKDSEVRELIKYTQNTLLVNGDLPPTMWNMRVLIPGSIYNSANPNATFSGADVWGKDVVLAYVAPSVLTPRTMTMGITFQSMPRYTSKWREEKKKSDSIEVAEKLVEKIVGSSCAYVIKDAIA